MMVQTENVNQSRSGKKLFQRKWFLLLCAVFAAFIAYLALDYFGPSKIMLQEDIIFGVPVLRIKNEELVVQEYDSEGNLWATRGMWAYRLKPGGVNFIRQYHVPTGFSIFWLRNFSALRRITLRPECIELLPISNGKAIAMSAGRMWYRSGDDQKFVETMKLRHYGVGIGQGIRNNGFEKLQNGTVLFGEYFANKGQTNVRLYSSEDDGKTWQVKHQFDPGEIRHIHAVQQDPYTEKAWILTGDGDEESMIAWTDDGGENLNPIGKGNQRWRVTQLAFTENALFWGADTRNAEESGIYRWDRKTHSVTKLAGKAGVIMYATRLSGGTIVMSASVERVNRNKNARTRMWIIIDGKQVYSLVFGERENRKKFAKLRFQRRQGNDSLALTVLNHKKFNNDLIIMSEKSLKLAARGANSNQ
jgi:hypothetical protein